jgi:hypothetical protein
MSFGVEKKKLEILLSRSCAVSQFTNENLETINSIFNDYAQIVRKLYARNPNIFANIHKYGLAEIKDHKRLVYKTPDQENFDNYKNYLEDSIAGSLTYINDFLHL